MNAEQLLERCQPVMEKMAWKYSIPGNALMTPEDLVQECTAKVLEIAAKPPTYASEENLVRYTLTACRRTCLCLVRDDWRKAGRTVHASMDDDHGVASFISDGTWEDLRRQIEKQERTALLRMIQTRLRRDYERKVLMEIISPGMRTLEFLEHGATVKQALEAGTGVSFHLVRKSLTEIRKVLSNAA